MTSPPPAAPAPGSGAPPTPPSPPPGPSQPPGPAPQPPAAPGAPADLAEELRAALADERRQRIEVQRRLDDLTAKHQTTEERALADARAEGATEAMRTAGLRVAAAEFRALAHGKLADPPAALEVLDLSRFVSDAGEVDTKALGALVEKLAKSLPAAAGSVPAGPRGDGQTDDFLRSSMGRHPRVG
jgi:hypothetical protein